MKAIIDIAPAGTSVARALARTKGNRVEADPDYYLHFETAKLLFADLTPARIDLLTLLQSVGACSVYRLAQAAQRHYANVHEDIAALEQLGLVVRDEGGLVRNPYDSIQINVISSAATAA